MGGELGIAVMIIWVEHGESWCGIFDFGKNNIGIFLNFLISSPGA